METPTSEPVSIVDRVNAAVASQESATPETPVAAAPPPAPFDPATIKIPDIESLPPHLLKFKGKDLNAISSSLLETERWGHSKSEEAAKFKRDNDDLRARLAAAEQVRSMLPQPAAQPPDPWGGINPNEAIFTDPQRVLDTNRQISTAEAKRMADEAEQRAVSKFEATLQKRDEANAFFLTFEAARNDLANRGYNLTQEQWNEHLRDVASPIAADPARRFVATEYANAFVERAERYSAFRPAAKPPTIPTEGAPPLASRTATVDPGTDKPTISRETRQLWKQVGEGLGFTGDRLKSFIESAGEAR